MHCGAKLVQNPDLHYLRYLRGGEDICDECRKNIKKTERETPSANSKRQRRTSVRATVARSKIKE